MKKRKIISLLLTTVIVLSGLYLFAGCTNEHDRLFETEYFVCSYNREKTEVSIMALTDKGKEQEILYFPREINGMKCTKISGMVEVLWGQVQHFFIESDNVKKIYIHDTYFFVDKNAFDKTPLEKVILMSKIAIDLRNGIEISDYISIPLNWGKRWFEGIKYMPANGEFYLDTEEESLFWIEYVGEDEMYMLPPDPKVDGKTFAGWYTDKEYKNKWGGEYEIKEETQKFYAKFE